jgi:hypothetical protein
MVKRHRNFIAGLKDYLGLRFGRAVAATIQ